MSNIKSLSELQVLIQNAVRSNELTSIDFNSIIIEKPPISVQARIKIYQDAYRIRMLESLRDDFSRVEEAIGENEFEKLAIRFIHKNPSKVRNLAEYSQSFPDFIKTQKPHLYPEAITDWLEILSLNAEPPTDQMSAEDVQSGKPFKIETLPSTLAEQTDKQRIIVHCFNGEAKFLDLNQVLFNFLKFLEIERSFEEISQFAHDNKIDENILSITITEWIQNKIIYCKAIE